MSDRFALSSGLRLQEYVIEDVLGFGGFGITYRASDLALKSTVAIKEYFPSSLAVRDNTSAVRSKSAEEDKDYRWGLRRFISEARTLAKFKHDNIVRVFRSFPENNTAYMVLEYVEGQNMETWLKELGRSPTQEELDGITRPIVEALSAVHEEHIFHRDVKPKNIYIRKADNSPVLLDFGAARYAFSEHSASTAAIVSRFYSPYECYSADAKIQGPWTDIYGMAATLYRAIRGVPPSEATSRVIQDDYVPLSALDSLKDKYRPAYLRAIDAGLSVFPKDRPQTAMEWLARLEGRGDALPIEVLTKSLASPRRSIVKPMLGTAGLVAAASLSVVFGYPYFIQKPAPALQESNVSKTSVLPGRNSMEAAIATPDRISVPVQQNGSPERAETQLAAISKDETEVRQNGAAQLEGMRVTTPKDENELRQNSSPQREEMRVATTEGLTELRQSGSPSHDEGNGAPASKDDGGSRQNGSPPHDDGRLAIASKDDTEARQTQPALSSGSEARFARDPEKVSQNAAVTGTREGETGAERQKFASLSPSIAAINLAPQANPEHKDLDADRIKLIQSKLVDKGCLKAAPNGVWDESSSRALKQLAAVSGKANVPLEPTQALYDALFNIEGTCVPRDKPASQENMRAKTVESAKQTRPKTAEHVRRSKPDSDGGHSSPPRVGGVSIGAGGLSF